jgi:hypothetical protein
MQVFCIQCGGWKISVERALGVPILYIYTCRECGHTFDSKKWSRYQKRNRAEVERKMEDLNKNKQQSWENL